MEFFIIIVGFMVAMFGSAMGAGGGFLLVPAMVALTDMSPSNIAGTSLLFVLCGKVTSWLGYHKMGLVDYKISRVFALPLLLGVFVGYSINRMLTMEQFSFGLGTMLAFMGLLVLTHHKLHIPSLPPHPMPVEGDLTDREGHHFHYSVGLRRSILVAFFVGIAVPLFGIGGSVLLVPLLITSFDVPEKVAVGTGQFVTLSAAAPGAFLFLTDAHISIDLALPLCLAAITGAFIGTRVGCKVETEVLRELMASTIMIAAIALIWRSVSG